MYRKLCGYCVLITPARIAARLLDSFLRFRKGATGGYVLH
jgi:hypothetical protein